LLQVKVWNEVVREELEVQKARRFRKLCKEPLKGKNHKEENE
jgi:hypothetical protein